MKAIDIQANIEHDGVSIRLPRLRVEVSRRQAERLRDALNGALDTASERIDPLHDPRVSDKDVLEAARSLLAEDNLDRETDRVLLRAINATMQGTGNRQEPPKGEPCRYCAHGNIVVDGEMQRCAHCDGTGYGPGGQPQPPAPKAEQHHYLLSIAGDVEPELSEPMATDRDVVEAARDYRRAHGDEDGLYRLTLRPGKPAPILVDTFRGWELETPPKKPSHWVSAAWVEGRNALVVPAGKRFETHTYETRNGSTSFVAKATFEHQGTAECAGSLWTQRGEWDQTLAIRSCCICKCEATGEAYGLPVCDYHADHSEDDPRCPNCAGKYRCERCENRNAEHVVRDVALCDRCNNVVQSVAIGDRVRDPLDGTWREIVGIDGLADGGTCHMQDGGNMSLDECAAAEKRLPSEELPS